MNIMISGLHFQAYQSRRGGDRKGGREAGARAGRERRCERAHAGARTRTREGYLF